jgi:hypothetical protein
MNTDGLVPSLFHEVKKAKQQLFSLVSTYKDKITTLKQEQEQKNFEKILEKSLDKEVHKQLDKIFLSFSK